MYVAAKKISIMFLLKTLPIVLFQFERQQTQEKAFELTQKLDSEFQDILPLLAQQVFTFVCLSTLSFPTKSTLLPYNVPSCSNRCLS